MKPATFKYIAPRSLAEALEGLAAHGDEAKVLAGGQSLGPLLNLRLATPGVIIDVNHVPDLAPDPADDGMSITLGALMRQRDAERSQVVASVCPLLAEALPFVAHRTIRNRGTVGGSMAHADPSAELPAVAVALDAQFTVASLRGTRTIAGCDFFQGYFTTSLQPDELLVSLRLPRTERPSGFAWQEFAPRRGDFAIVGVAATARLGDDGRVAGARLVYSGIADVPQRCRVAEEILIGEFPTAALAAAAAAAAAAASRAPSDLIASTEYRRQLVSVLTERALHVVFERVQEG